MPSNRPTGTETVPKDAMESTYFMDSTSAPFGAMNIPAQSVLWLSGFTGGGNRPCAAEIETWPTNLSEDKTAGEQLQGYFDKNNEYITYEVPTQLRYAKFDGDGTPTSPALTSRETLALMQAGRITSGGRQASAMQWTEFLRNVMNMPYNRHTGKPFKISTELTDYGGADRDDPMVWHDAEGVPGTEDYSEGYYEIPHISLTRMLFERIGLVYPVALDTSKFYVSHNDEVAKHDGSILSYGADEAALQAAANDEERDQLKKAAHEEMKISGPQPVFMLEVTPDGSEDDVSGYEIPQGQQKALYPIAPEICTRIIQLIDDFGLEKHIRGMNMPPLYEALKARASCKLDLVKAKEMYENSPHPEDVAPFGAPAYMKKPLASSYGNHVDALSLVKRCKHENGFLPMPSKDSAHFKTIDSIFLAMAGKAPDPEKKGPRPAKRGFVTLPVGELESIQNDAKRHKVMADDLAAKLDQSRSEITELKKSISDMESAKVVHAKPGQAISIGETNLLVPREASGSLHLLDQAADGASLPLRSEHGVRVMFVAARPQLTQFPGLYPALH